MDNKSGTPTPSASTKETVAPDVTISSMMLILVKVHVDSKTWRTLPFAKTLMPKLPATRITPQTRSVKVLRGINSVFYLMTQTVKSNL